MTPIRNPLFAEELARTGARVIGVDPSTSSLANARAHAAAVGLSIDYRAGAGEKLPLEDASVDIACCVDVLEHVNDVDAVIGAGAGAARPIGLERGTGSVLRPGERHETESRWCPDT